MSITTRLMPLVSFINPKEKRGVLQPESIPTQPNSSPSAPPIRPFAKERPAAEAIIVREKSISTAYSEGPKFSAIVEIGPATMIRITLLNRQPNTELYSASLMALPACPFLANA